MGDMAELHDMHSYYDEIEVMNDGGFEQRKHYERSFLSLPDWIKQEKRWTKMIIKNVRVDWLFCFERSKKDKYSVCVMLPKNHPQLEAVKAAIDAAKANGISGNKFTAAQTKATAFKQCLRDGDQEAETGERPEHYRGHFFFNANNKDQPGIVGPDLNPLMDKDRLYSGCFCNVDINFYPYSHPDGGKGVGAGFNNIMLVKEGDRLDGRQSAEEAFAGLEADNGDLQ